MAIRRRGTSDHAKYARQRRRDAPTAQCMCVLSIDRPLLPSRRGTWTWTQCALRPSSPCLCSSSSWPRPSAPSCPPSLAPAHARMVLQSVRAFPLAGWLAGLTRWSARACVCACVCACVVTVTALPFPRTTIARRAAAAPLPPPVPDLLPPFSALSDAADGGRRRVRVRPSPSECVLAWLPA